MLRIKTALLATTLLAAGAGAWAQSGPTYDPAQLPETKGKVAQYTLTPRGEVDGLILEDGTEVNTSPRVASQLVFSIKPGDAVTIHGLKAKSLPLVAAASVTNDATGVTVTGEWRREPERSQMDVTGTVKTTLHGARGELNGVVLSDGTIVRLPPPEAQRLSAQLVAGKPLTVRGDGEATPLGRVVAAQEIGPDANSLTPVASPHGPGWGHWMHAMMGGGHEGPGGPDGPGGHEGPGGPGPDGRDGGPPPPPPPGATTP